MKSIPFLGILIWVSLVHVVFADDADKLAQEFASAMVKSVSIQVEAGTRDFDIIKKKATEDTEPEEKKLRAAMKAKGDTPQQIEIKIKELRETFLEGWGKKTSTEIGSMNAMSPNPKLLANWADGECGGFEVRPSILWNPSYQLS